VHRDSFNTIQIGIVTKCPCEVNEIPCVAVGFGTRLFCLSFDTRSCTKYRWENLIWAILVVLYSETSQFGDVCWVARIVEYVAYFMAKLEWHRSLGHGVQLVCHA